MDTIDYQNKGKRKVDMKKVNRELKKLFEGAGMHNADLDTSQGKLEKLSRGYEDDKLNHRNASKTLRIRYS